jgi:hypothetical protein
VKREVGEKLIERIKWWEHYTEVNEGEMNNNPSPGNKAGGLTTILEKSLGAVAKGGTTNLQAVYEYAETVKDHGFVYMDTPGLRPGQRDGPGGGRGQHDLLHHRPRVGLRLRALAFAEAGDQLGSLEKTGRRHGHQLRRDHRRQGFDPGDGPAHLRTGAGHCLG